MNALETAQILIDKDQELIKLQADHIAELEKDNQAYIKIAAAEHKIAVEHEQRVLELEKDLHMVQRHNDQQDIKLLSHDEIWAYAHIHKISGDVVKFARALEAKIRSEG